MSKVITMRHFLISNFFIAMTLISCAQQDHFQTSIAKLHSMTNIKTDTATLGAGCFWCVEAVFQQLDGVLKVTSGYSGGHVPNPTYEQVCEKNTGHVEVAQIVYDPTKITFDELLEVFWKTHDPTTVDQQGNDQGPQYRSVIFYNSPEQKHKAEQYKTALNKSGAWDKPLVTSIEPLKNFYVAEDYHQNYYNNNRDQLYCRYVIQPKLEKFEKVFKDKLKGNKEQVKN
jgi:peptide-methionine (S)-S-oxide reductase